MFPFRILDCAFTLLLLQCLLSLVFLVGGEKEEMQCRGWEPSLQSSLHGSARPWERPSRHHQAMTPGSVVRAQDECGHM